MDQDTLVDQDILMDQDVLVTPFSDSRCFSDSRNSNSVPFCSLFCPFLVHYVFLLGPFLVPNLSHFKVQSSEEYFDLAHCFA